MPIPDEHVVLDPRQGPAPTLGSAIERVKSKEGLLGALSKDSPDRARAEFEVAEAYADLESAAAAQGHEKPEHAKAAEKARALAILHYSACQSTGHAQSVGPQEEGFFLDRAAYELALEYQRGNDVAGTRKALFDVVSRYPTSRFVARAYLIFGELFVAEATADPSKYAFAEQSFDKAAAAATEPPVRALALSRLAATADAAGHADVASRARQELGAK
jgi:TolA-binding protein